MFRVVGLTEFTLHFGEVVVGNNHVFRTIGIQSDCTVGDDVIYIMYLGGFNHQSSRQYSRPGDI